MKSAPAQPFAPRIIAWQRSAGRHGLPWQGERDAYRIWLSEVMLQQTQVATVVPYFERFVAAFPNVDALAAAPLERVLELWSGLGYYSRARNLHAGARRVVEQWGGRLPRDPELLATLPGVGRSTAAAIAVFAYGGRAAILDGNVKRVLCRHFGVDGDPAQARIAARLWSLAEALLPQRHLEPYTQGLMDLGATLCTTRNPQCARCPVASSCVALAEARVTELPTRRAARAVPQRQATLLLLHHRGEILLEKRAPTGIWGGLWCLPQSERPDDQTWALALAAQHGESAAHARLAPVVHGFTHFRLHAEVIAIDLARRTQAAAAPVAGLWLDLADASGAALPAPIKRRLVELYRASPWHGFAQAAPGHDLIA